MARKPAFLLAAVFVAGVGLSLLVYAPTYGFGFHYDDYYFLRPHARGDVAAAFSGPWYPPGVMAPFYRPLTVAFHALRFDWLQLDSHAYHTLSIVLLAIVGGLTGTFAWLTTRHWRPALASTLLTVAHPAAVHSLGAFITNQMHSVEAIVIVSALCLWASTLRRRESVLGWASLMALAAIAFLFKEDGVSLLPAVVLLHVMYRRYVQPNAPRLSRAILLAAAGEIVVLILIRQWALNGLGGYGVVSLPEMAANVLRGPRRVLLFRDGQTSWAYLPTLAVTAIACGAGWWAILRDKQARARGLLIAGAVLLLCFDVTFVFASKPEQWHVLTIGSGLSFAAAIDGLARMKRPLLWTLVLATQVLGFGISSRTIIAEYAPTSDRTLRRDREVLSWHEVSYEIRAQLREKLTEPHGAAATIEHLPIVTFGISDPVVDQSTGTSLRPLCGRSDLYVNPRFHAVSFSIKASEGVPIPSLLTATSDAARTVAAIGPEWTLVSESLADRPSSAYRHIELNASSCTLVRDLAAF